MLLFGVRSHDLFPLIITRAENRIASGENLSPVNRRAANFSKLRQETDNHNGIFMKESVLWHSME